MKDTMNTPTQNKSHLLGYTIGGAAIAVLIAGGILWQLDYFKTQVPLTPVVTVPTTPSTPTPTTPEPTTPQLPSGFVTFTDPVSGYHFSYQEKIGGTYVRGQTWPPNLHVVTNPSDLFCAEGTTNNGTHTEELRISGSNTVYCVIAQTEGAAGSKFVTYEVSWIDQSAVLTLTFAVRMPNSCDLYDGVARTDCQKEVNSWNVSTLLKQILPTVKKTT